MPQKMGEEEGQETTLKGAGPLREESSIGPPPFLQTWTPHPNQPGRVILGARGRSCSLSSFPTDPASNVGRALQKEVWAHSQFGKAEP